jgi:hypothetical protein
MVGGGAGKFAYMHVLIDIPFKGSMNRPPIVHAVS